MGINLLIRRKHNNPRTAELLDPVLHDCQLVSMCKKCKVNTYDVIFMLGEINITTRMEDNGKVGGMLAEWFLN